MDVHDSPPPVQHREDDCSDTGTESSAAAISCRSIIASESSSVHAGSGAPPTWRTPTWAS
jgi:hypothetical protein